VTSSQNATKSARRAFHSTRPRRGGSDAQLELVILTHLPIEQTDGAVRNRNR